MQEVVSGKKLRFSIVHELIAFLLFAFDHGVGSTFVPLSVPFDALDKHVAHNCARHDITSRCPVLLGK